MQCCAAWRNQHASRRRFFFPRPPAAHTGVEAIVDALFGPEAVVTAKQRPGLPAPAERSRLRTDSGLSAHQVADACDVTEETLLAWEQGTAAPLGDSESTYGFLLCVLQARRDGTQVQLPAPPLLPDWAALGSLRHEIPTNAAAQEPCRRCQELTTQRVGGRPQHLGTRCPGPGAPAAPSAAPPTSPVPVLRQRTATSASPTPTSRATQLRPPVRVLPYPPVQQRQYTDGPLAVLDATDTGLTAQLADGRVRSCPAGTLPDLLAWTLHTPLGAPPVRAEALPSGPLLVLTPKALTHLGLPMSAPTTAQCHPRSDHPLLTQLRTIGWQSDDHGLGPWMRLHPSTSDPACDSVHLAVTAWGALHHDTWQLPEQLTPAQLAAVLGQYAFRVRTPVGEPGICGHRLMSDLRPPRHRHATTGAVLTDGAPGALTTLTDPAPCEAPAGHQLAHGDTLADTDIDWWRPPTAEEAQYPHVVCLAVNLHHFADSNNVRIANGPARHFHHPAFDPKIPGSWLVDLSTIASHPRLPPAFASRGLAWHTTPALAYATLHGLRPQPVQAWLRTAQAGPYFNPWYQHLRQARLAVLQRLGLASDMDTPSLLAALDNLPSAEPSQRALLHAMHTTIHDAFTAMALPPAQPDQALLGTWPTPKDPTWRPDARAAITANARANLHRKLCRTARDGYFPLAVADDHVVYATRTPLLTEITETQHHGFRIGLSPGQVRPVTVRPMAWYQDQCTDAANAARTLKNSLTAW
ncbi:telomere-associated protein Tap [Streptomyces sp. NPDC058385]|uniref:telomere-associated protein Tap n=1 Tax=Streptomyces sp. NPDC058385 TaxID=3346473 RepID=UPI00364C57FF